MIDGQRQLTRKRVAQWSMSAELGHVRSMVEEEHPYIGHEVPQKMKISEQAQHLIDLEVHAFIIKCETKRHALNSYTSTGRD